MKEMSLGSVCASRSCIPGIDVGIGVSYASAQCTGYQEAIRMVTSLLLYPYVFVAGPNKHDRFHTS